MVVLLLLLLGNGCFYVPRARVCLCVCLSFSVCISVEMCLTSDAIGSFTIECLCG